ncbi:MAG: peptidoglycan D,D-transpeptidase FtsI family protein [Pseudomonadales bacterium]
MAWRHFALVSFFVLAGIGLVVRVIFLNVTEGQFLIDQGERRSVKAQQIAAHRGVIYDRFGEPLAVSTPAAAIYTNPREGALADSDLSTLCEALEMNCPRLKSRLAGLANRNFAYIRRGVAWEDARRVEALKVPGVALLQEYRRFYPAGETTAHVVGITDIDDVGIEGIELAFDDRLQGEPGRKIVLKDRRGNVIKDLEHASPPQFGTDLTLSLDLRLQFIAYRELKSAVQTHRASAGSMVMLDVATGEILALVNQPSYNPNDTVEDARSMRNRAVTDLYEPGSTMKPFTALAALASGRFNRDSVVDTTPGYMWVGRKLIEGRDRGPISLEMALKKSSQVGFAKIALALDTRAVYDVLSQAGVGDFLGTGLPGEATGRLTDADLDKPIVRITLAYGYGLAITPLQLAEAYMTLANGGVRLPVSILRRDAPPAGERVLDQDLVQEVVSMMEGVTDRDGTAPLAHVEGFRVAGKTGTIRKVGTEGYEDDRHAAWFAGMAPASRPRIVAVVLIDEPKGEQESGGEVAAPVFGRTMARALHLLGVAPDAVQLARAKL